MPFIPHTKHDVETMLATIGVAKVEDLFDEIPDSLRNGWFN
jgi:glycine dehydrogenase subunit 1